VAPLNAQEHRAIGDAAFGRGVVNLGGGDLPHEALWLSYGDVMALSGDLFRPEHEPQPTQAGTQGASEADSLFRLARTPGDHGRLPGTRDEIVCALKVMAVDALLVDSRFEPGGQFGDFRFSALATSTDVERRVRDRYLRLAATNDDHFVDPGGVTHDHPARPFGSAVLAYRRFHEVAIDLACELGRAGDDVSQAMAREAAAQHFLTDAFTAGHLRTPVARIRRYWRARYPAFWSSLQRRVAASTAATLRELSWALGRLPAGVVEGLTLAAVTTRTSRYPQLSVGDFIARLFHDWDNSHGVVVEGGGVVFGDGHVDRGVTRALALAAARAGIDDVEAAFELGASGSTLTGAELHRAVRTATGSVADAYVAETKVPRPSSANRPQNWCAPDVETLWVSPLLGGAGTTVGEALAEMLDPDGQFIRQLDRLGQGLVEDHVVLSAPVVGERLRRTGAAAFRRGFVESLAAQPQEVILSVVHGTAAGAERPVAGHPRRRRPRARRVRHAHGPHRLLPLRRRLREPFGCAAAAAAPNRSRRDDGSR